MDAYNIYATNNDERSLSYEPFSQFAPAALSGSNALQFAPSLNTPLPSTSSLFFAAPLPLPTQTSIIPPQASPHTASLPISLRYTNQAYDAPTARSPAPKAHPPSPVSPKSSPGERAPRAAPLHRGEACLHCRKRKMKCDALKPACGPCSRSGNECEYEISPYLKQIHQLQDEAIQLRARLAELEGRSPVSNSSSISPLSSQTETYLPPLPSPTAYEPTGYTAYAPQRNDVW
ncbi:hypothetical protein BKA62DRAFT_713959 [Auriculariales sp. MPI-PUGE-AT-0066]|nr:hypothetical protein BKA62DRAFT_713959 [Auriculariales sp. MPI-PUGE-AT-0066]